jgi:hypothetical protein
MPPTCARAVGAQNNAMVSNSPQKQLRKLDSANGEVVIFTSWIAS